MSDPLYLLAFLSFLVASSLFGIWRRRIRMKIFSGDGGDPGLKLGREQLQGLITCGTIGVALLFALDMTGDDRRLDRFFQGLAGPIFFLALLSEVVGKRENGIMSYWYVIGRGLFIVMTACTSLYLFYLWSTKASIF